MAGIKELKTRIKSIGSTRKITRAMQMVSAAKMRKAQNATLQSRSYASLAWEMVSSVIPSEARSAEPRNPLSEDSLRDPSATVGVTNKEEAGMTPLLQTYPDAQKTGVVLLTSNRGLVGSLNSNLMGIVKGLNGSDGENGEAETIAEIVTYGKKGQVIAARLKKNVVADFPKFDRTISVEDIYPIAKFITESYQTGHYKKIVIVYNQFVSTLSQKPMVKQLLPFKETSDHVIASTDASVGAKQSNPGKDRHGPTGLAMTEKTGTADFIFEPNPTEVINHLIPRIIESQIYQTILESDASEHSARMVMMKNATEAAGDLISDLTLTFNQLRQNKITTELAEITAGKIALE